jgi:hypothetical protein
MHESQPPEPIASATSQSGHLRDAGLPAQLPHRLDQQEDPAHAGWQLESPPPSVLSGSFPPRRRWPSATNAPPSPFLQKPASSSSTSTVIVKLS